jgi:hypothetical protein
MVWRAFRGWFPDLSQEQAETANRKIFDELLKGVAAMKSHREGKLTLRTYKKEETPLPPADSKYIREIRQLRDAF